MVPVGALVVAPVVRAAGRGRSGGGFLGGGLGQAGGGLQRAGHRDAFGAVGPPQGRRHAHRPGHEPAQQGDAQVRRHVGQALRRERGA
ncbi:hypothetical protein MF672_037605 [Actinomadura sp. ATCC 31491]|uniref:Uncharacterized protein n=1 Tax=Actinomadura luzonensis TaxID=2805427 RepID=A0ABT0G4H5_9ACTN|nr:hypothetical protein [Actinomadura luzonensis]MCK2219472.1 hypothetical protein [Actinomadura luzonensis]